MADRPDDAAGGGAAEGLRDREGGRPEDGGVSGGSVHRDGGPVAEPAAPELPLREAGAEPDTFIESVTWPIPYTEAERYSIFVPGPGTLTVSGTYSESFGSALVLTFKRAGR